MTDLVSWHARIPPGMVGQLYQWRIVTDTQTVLVRQVPILRVLQDTIRLQTELNVVGLFGVVALSLGGTTELQFYRDGQVLA